MPLLLRTAMEQRCMRRVALMLLHLSSLAIIGNVPAAAIFYNRRHLAESCGGVPSVCEAA